MVSISEFDSEDVGSSPAPITNVGFSLSGKAPHCECGEQGSIPGVNQKRMMTRSSIVRAGTLYVQGYRFESGRVNENMLLHKLVRNSTGSEYRSFTPGVQGSNPCGPTNNVSATKLESRSGL